MFEFAKLTGTPPRGIVLQTRQGRNIPNSQAPPPDNRHFHQYALFRAGRQWEHRKDACGTYNCFGHVFGSRRTAIYESSDVARILVDDGFRQIQTLSGEAPRVGDLAVYRNPGNPSDIHHVGEIVRFEGPSNARTPWILSKWNDHFGEDIHQPTDLPNMFPPYALEYWTEREP